MLTPLIKHTPDTVYRVTRPEVLKPSIKLLTLANCVGTILKMKGGK